MSLTKECCTRPPVTSDYTAKGASFKLGDLSIYETVDKTPKRLLIHVYDIFGMHPNANQFADIVATAGFRVVIPDNFRGVPWDMNNFPPRSKEDIFSWLKEAGSWDKIVKSDLLNLIEHYKKQGVTSFGIYGFCWGAKIATLASIELPEIKGAGLIHPSLVETTEGLQVKSPVLVIPSKDDADFVPFVNNVKENLGKDSIVHVRFEDIFHGFAAGRGDFTNELNRKRVDETIDLLLKFFNKHCPQ